MLVSHSPPVFSHSPPAGFLSEYTPFRFSTEIAKVPRGTCRFPSTYSIYNKISSKMPALPRRPCLVIRPTEDFSSSDEDPTSPTKLKKKVVFADDKGMSLTHVRVMSEPSNVPPLWSNRFLNEVTQGITADPVGLRDPWEITFPQPASDYVDFRKRLDSCKVSLENVIVKFSEKIIVGTVKVSNIAFDKEVIIRSSTDDWKTHEDAFCNYVENSISNNLTSAYVLYDTFSFKLPLPLKEKKIEFCVCYRCNGEENWDNNNSKNYIILNMAQPSINRKSYSCSDMYDRDKKLNGKVDVTSRCVDAIQAKLDSWSEFASWNHLENSSPYW